MRVCVCVCVCVSCVIYTFFPSQNELEYVLQCVGFIRCDCLQMDYCVSVFCVVYQTLLRACNVAYAEESWRLTQ